jgi:hypothetical protein
VTINANDRSGPGVEARVVLEDDDTRNRRVDRIAACFQHLEGCVDGCTTPVHHAGRAPLSAVGDRGRLPGKRREDNRARGRRLLGCRRTDPGAREHATDERDEADAKERPHGVRW